MTGERAAFHPEAADELRAAVSWYGERSPRAADEFIAELDDALGKIQESPARWRRVLGTWRRYVLHRFPFLIIYREVSQGIEVAAIMHGRRRPGYWRSRIG
jgi:plasmid stabilization system protein ParE